MKRATIKDVAKKAGVSISAVSFVLNDTPGHTIPESTREKVLDAVRELDYIPDIKAQGMRTKRTMVLGLVSFWDVTEPVFIEILNGVYRAADKNNYIITICNLNSPQREFSYVELFKRKQIDGIVFISPYESKNSYDENTHIIKIKENKIPAVIIHGNTRDEDLSYIYVDHFNTTYMAAEYLIKLGHSKLGYLEPDANETKYISDERLRGFVTALEKSGLPVEQDYIFKAGRSGKIAEIIKSGCGPTGIVANKSTYASGFLKTMLDFGIKVPEQVSVIAANTVPYAVHLYPPLTSVQIPFEEMGESGVEILVDSMNGKISQLKLKLPNKLTVRESCRKI